MGSRRAHPHEWWPPRKAAHTIVEEMFPGGELVNQKKNTELE